MISNNVYLLDIQKAATQPINWQQLSGKTILVTGATGMIASVLIDIIMYRNKE